MPHVGETHGLVSPTANAQQQIGVDTAQAIVLEKSCVAIMCGARGQNVSVTFDNTTPSATNGLAVIAGAQPAYFPLGYSAEASHTLRAIGLAAGGFLDVLQLS